MANECAADLSVIIYECINVHPYTTKFAWYPIWTEDAYFILGRYICFEDPSNRLNIGRTRHFKHVENLPTVNGRRLVHEDVLPELLRVAEQLQEYRRSRFPATDAA